jgi:hypothetical protein
MPSIQIPKCKVWQRQECRLPGCNCNPWWYVAVTVRTVGGPKDGRVRLFAERKFTTWREALAYAISVTRDSGPR